MANIFGGVEPPQWLERVAKPADPTIAGQVIGQMVGGLANAVGDSIDAGKAQHTSWLKELPSHLQQGMTEARLNTLDPFWQIKKEQAELNIAHTAVQMGDTLSQINLRKQKMGMLAADQQEWTKLLQDHPTWRSRQGMDTPSWRTPEYQKNWFGLLKADSTSLQARAYEDAHKSFKDRLKELGDLGDTDGASKYAKYLNEVEIPEEASSGLSGAIATAKSKQAEQKRLAGADTSQIKNVNQIAEWEEAARKADASGDAATAKNLREKASELREQLKGQNISVGYDDQGRAIVNIGKGTQPTVATQTMSQGKLLQYENATQLMNYLSQNLTEEHVGIRGSVGEFVMDKTLEQFFPGSADKERIRSRTTLIGLRESLLREMSDDRTGRFSVADRQEIGQALPSSGLFESKQDAIERIGRVREILSDRGKVYARNMGVRPPMWTLNKDEIVKMYQDGLKSDLKPNSPEFKKQFLTKEEAVDALTRFH